MIYAIFRTLSGIALAAPLPSLPTDTSSAASHTPLIVYLCVDRVLIDLTKGAAQTIRARWELNGEMQIVIEQLKLK